ncbi:gas vesicle protein [Streptomyces sp. NPDC127108]|uniref:gas vesicle protein n=1 Tax=Streptomyces sp. NPDC127108 TaxID=3345361 RepID=UPI00363E9F23
MGTSADRVRSASVEPFARREIALVDLLDRLLAGGVVIAGDITLRIADVDLVRIDLKALISAVNAQVPSPWPTADVREAS